jgi:hypothetical protein
MVESFANYSVVLWISLGRKQIRTHQVYLVNEKEDSLYADVPTHAEDGSPIVGMAGRLESQVNATPSGETNPP